jgi:phosphate transport system protein
MTRSTFERELRELQDRLLALGSEVSENIVAAVEVLGRSDTAGAERLIASDKDVNRKRIGIMSDALTLIATQQPMASDLRLIASIIAISGELERINDYAKGIAKNSLMIGEATLPAPSGNMPEMARKTAEMLRRALEAFGRRDAAAARAIPEADDEIDNLFTTIYRQLVEGVAESPDSYELFDHLEWALHNLERAADRVTNICEWIVYNATGEYAEMDSEFETPPAVE